MHRLYIAVLMFALLRGISCAQTAPTPVPSSTQAVVEPPPPLFTDKERADIVAYWNAPGRYVFAAPSDATTEGPYRVRLTPDGSQWFWNYQRVVAGKAKLPPTADIKPKSGPYAEWE